MVRKHSVIIGSTIGGRTEWLITVEEFEKFKKRGIISTSAAKEHISPLTHKRFLRAHQPPFFKFLQIPCYRQAYYLAFVFHLSFYSLIFQSKYAGFSFTFSL